MLRNKELRQLAVLCAVITAAAAALGFTVHPAAGMAVLLTAAALDIVFFVFTRARYKSIARISDEIDRVLHHGERFCLGEAVEGELAILHSEISKMTLRIREQNEALIKEKEHLADSLADIAHQLRTPLTSANLILSLLANTADENDRKLFVRETEELLLRMDWLITSLLKLSRLDAGVVVFKSERMEVRRLFDAALRPFLIAMDLHNIEVRIDAPEGVLLQGDFGWLSEALQNILKNCMESAGDDGKIELLCTDTPLFIEIVIIDSGAGFQEKELSHLFDRFYRGKSENTAGYGIGLALCRTIITRQGGTITAKNRPRGGAAFIIRFPK